MRYLLKHDEVHEAPRQQDRQCLLLPTELNRPRDLDGKRDQKGKKSKSL